MKISVKDLVRFTKGELLLGDPKTIINRAVVDSRSIRAGDLFVALKGLRTDGHKFIDAAERAGARCVLVSSWDWFEKGRSFSTAVVKVKDTLLALQGLAISLRDGFQGPVIGITGSNGKTTTKHMVGEVMAAKGAGLLTRGNLNSQIGLPMVISELESDQKWMVLEMGASEPGNIHQLVQLAKPTIGIITTIGHAHLESFGSIENVAKTKWELIDGLPANGCAILPWGDQYLAPMIRNYKGKIIYFGEDSSCPVRASSIEVGKTVQFTLHLGSESSVVHLPIPGRFNVMNALAAAAAGWTCGVTLPEIVHALEFFEPPKMRMEILNHTSGALIVNDAYNANPSSMISSIRSFVESYPDKKKILVLGSMLELGQDSYKFHFHLGVDLTQFGLEAVYFVGDDMQKAYEGSQSRGSTPVEFAWIKDRGQLVKDLASRLTDQHAVLFKASRGIALEEVIEPLTKNTSLEIS